MIPYIVFAIIILFSYLMKNKRIMILTLVLFSVLRYDVGWDYEGYMMLVSGSKDPTAYSFIWQWLFSFAGRVGVPHLAVAIPNALSYLVIYAALNHWTTNDEKTCKFLLVYSMWPFFYLASFSVIRQSLACAVFILMYVVLTKKKYVFALLLFAINILLHPSSLITALVFPLLLYQHRLKIWHYIVIIGVLVIGFSRLSDLLSLLGLNMYLQHLETSDDNGQILQYLYLLVACFIFINRRRYNTLPIEYQQIIDLVFLSFVSCFVTMQLGVSSILLRAFDYFNSLLIIVFFPIVSIGKNRRLFEGVLVFLLVALFFIYFAMIGDGTNDASSGYIPYHTIFSM